MSANITLKDIIERKIFYAKSERDNAVPVDFSVTDPYDITYEEFTAIQNGEIRALEEMLADIQTMSEKEFTEKYMAIAKTLGKKFDEELDEKYNRIVEAKEKGTDVYEIFENLPPKTEEVGYNNAIVDILMLFNPENLFAHF